MTPRPLIVSVLAVLQFIGAGVCLLAAMGGSIGLVAADQDRGVAIALALCFAGLGALQLVCGLGLWKLRPYGRILQLVFAWIGLLAIPLGTIVSILVLIYLFRPGVKLLFSGRPAEDLTAEESALVARAAGGSSSNVVLAVIVAIVCVVGLVVVAAVTAAIAVPGLLRARTSGREAAAISSLRTINAAQAVFAATCGDGAFAATLAALGIPAPGTQEPFLPTDLAGDPVVTNGYVIVLTAGEDGPAGAVGCNGARLTRTYFAAAQPADDEAGARFFATNQGGTIYQAPSRILPAFTGPPDNAAPILR